MATDWNKTGRTTPSDTISDGVVRDLSVDRIISPVQPQVDLFNFSANPTDWALSPGSDGSVSLQVIEGIQCTTFRTDFVKTKDKGVTKSVSARYTFPQPLNLTQYLPEDSQLLISYLWRYDSSGGDLSNAYPSSGYFFRLETSPTDYWDIYWLNVSGHFYEQNHSYNGTSWSQFFLHIPPGIFTGIPTVGSPDPSNVKSIYIGFTEDYDPDNGDTITGDTASASESYAKFQLWKEDKSAARRSTVFLSSAHKLVYPPTIRTLTVGENGQYKTIARAYRAMKAMDPPPSPSDPVTLLLLPGKHTWPKHSDWSNIDEYRDHSIVDVGWRLEGVRFKGMPGSSIAFDSTVQSFYLDQGSMKGIWFEDIVFENGTRLEANANVNLVDVLDEQITTPSSLDMHFRNCLFYGVGVVVHFNRVGGSEVSLSLEGCTIYLDEHDTSVVYTFDTVTPDHVPPSFELTPTTRCGGQNSNDIRYQVRVKNCSFVIRLWEHKRKVINLQFAFGFTGTDGTTDFHPYGAPGQPDYTGDSYLLIDGCTFVAQNGNDGQIYRYGRLDSHCLRFPAVPPPHTVINGCTFYASDLNSQTCDITPFYLHGSNTGRTDTYSRVVMTNCSFFNYGPNYTGGSTNGGVEVVRDHFMRSKEYGADLRVFGCEFYRLTKHTVPPTSNHLAAGIIGAWSPPYDPSYLPAKITWGSGNVSNGPFSVVRNTAYPTTIDVIGTPGLALVSTSGTEEYFYPVVEQQTQLGTYTTLGNIKGYIPYDVNGTTYYIPLYDSIT